MIQQSIAPVRRIVSLCSHSWWEGRQAFQGWHKGQTTWWYRLSAIAFVSCVVFPLSGQSKLPSMAFLDAGIGFEKQDGNSRPLSIKGHTKTCKDWRDQKTVWTVFSCRCWEFPYVQKLLPGFWLEKLSFHTPQSASTPEFHTDFPRLLATHPDYAGKMFTVKSTFAQSWASVRKSLV